jgi:hypothetical protein
MVEGPYIHGALMAALGRQPPWQVRAAGSILFVGVIVFGRTSWFSSLPPKHCNDIAKYRHYELSGDRQQNNLLRKPSH